MLERGQQSPEDYAGVSALRWFAAKNVEEKSFFKSNIDQTQIQMRIIHEF